MWTRTPDARTAEREALERRWRGRLREASELADIVTGAQNRDEPFHRWLAYKQAFAPALVRQFLEETSDSRRAGLPLLDPFSGSGTFAIECARRGLAAIGVEAIAALAFLTRAREAREAPRFPSVDGLRDWREFATRLTLPIHQAALMLAEARRHDSDGRPLARPPTLRAALGDVLREIREDLRQPLPAAPDARAGDARRLSDIEAASIGGALTSPPYLSRHDYLSITAPISRVFESWYPAQSGEPAQQTPAHPRARQATWQSPPHPATLEACAALRQRGAQKLARVTRSYFDSLSQALAELARVLAPGAPLWVVIGGARLKDVYVPADLILAEDVERLGFVVTEVRVARRLIESGRKLGALEDVAPREVVLVARRAGSSSSKPRAGPSRPEFPGKRPRNCP